MAFTLCACWQMPLLFQCLLSHTQLAILTVTALQGWATDAPFARCARQTPGPAALMQMWKRAGVAAAFVGSAPKHSSCAWGPAGLQCVATSAETVGPAASAHTVRGGLPRRQLPMTRQVHGSCCWAAVEPAPPSPLTVRRTTQRQKLRPRWPTSLTSFPPGDARLVREPYLLNQACKVQLQQHASKGIGSLATLPPFLPTAAAVAVPAAVAQQPALCLRLSQQMAVPRTCQDPLVPRAT